ncbi:MAG: SUMF1/EgtB/PvdO family nonheme iron enzyme [Bacteroidota bacterium]
MPSASTTGGNQRAGRSKRQESASTVTGHLHFLGIGINEYGSDDWPNLNNAVRDVRAIAQKLQTDYGLSEANTHLLEDANASRARILRELDELSGRVKPVDSLIIYYAGHGHLITKNKNKRGFWVPVDGTAKGVHSFIRNSAVKELLADIDSLHTLLISDSCFSGSLFVRSQRSSKLTATELHQLPSRWAICSGRHDETVADGPLGGHSPFAESILDVLSNTEREYITTNFLYEQVRDQTRSNYDQIPDGGPLASVGHKRGEFVFQRRAEEAPDAEKTAELEAELAKCDELLLQKEFRKAKRRLRVLKEEIHEELQTELAETRLLAAVEERIGFCESYRQYSEWYERLEQRALLLSEQRYEERLIKLRQQEEESIKKLSIEERWEAITDGSSEELTQAQELQERNPVKQQSSESVRNVPGMTEKMVLVEGGAFEMGDVLGEGEKNEKPVHTVTLRDFYIGIHAVTFAEYDLYCKAAGVELPPDEGWGRGQRPVIRVNWFEAVKYCNWLSEQAGRKPVYTINEEGVSADWDVAGFRLPTEAEWEFAARGSGQKIRFGNGKDEANSAEINYNASSASIFNHKGSYRRKTVPVGSLSSPNSLGLHDMSGNVWEWCWDWWGEYLDFAQEQPVGPASGSRRVLRGGSWFSGSSSCRLVYRYQLPPASKDISIGFRVVLSTSSDEANE